MYEREWLKWMKYSNNKEKEIEILREMKREFEESEKVLNDVKNQLKMKEIQYQELQQQYSQLENNQSFIVEKYISIAYSLW